MADKDTEHPRDDDHATRPVWPPDQSRPSDADPAGATPRDDDRNETVDDSPAPDPEEGVTPEDDPEAD
jgi:hypothetical protein